MYNNRYLHVQKKMHTTIERKEQQKNVLTTFSFAVLDANYYNLERRKSQTIYIYLNISLM